MNRIVLTVLPAVLITILSLSLLYAQQTSPGTLSRADTQQQQGWYCHKKSFTFSDMLAAARRNHFTLRISSEANQINKLEKINNPRSTRGLDHARIAKL